MRWSKLAAVNLDVVSIFYIAYVSFLVALSTPIVVERIGYRYISPAFVPAVLAVLYLLEKALFLPGKTNTYRLFGAPVRIPRSPLATALVVGVFAIATAREVATMARPVEPENNVNHFAWRTSETLQFAKGVWLSQGGRRS